MHRSQPAQIDHVEKVTQRAAEPIAFPNREDVEGAPADLLEDLIEAWPRGLGAGNEIDVFAGDGPSALFCELAKR